LIFGAASFPCLSYPEINYLREEVDAIVIEDRCM
jgi:hypothetical protein